MCADGAQKRHVNVVPGRPTALLRGPARLELQPPDPKTLLEVYEGVHGCARSASEQAFRELVHCLARPCTHVH